MRRKVGLTIGMVLLMATGLGATANAGPLVLGGKGAPQSENCKALGGTENGTMCVLEGGACQSMPLFRDGSCLDVDGNVVEDGPDVGSNMGPDDSNSSDDSSGDSGSDSGGDSSSD